jgi:hypothetical protein
MSAYVTVTEAINYLGHRLGGKAWVEADDSDKEASLIMATQAIDTLQYVGQTAVEGQEHSFPRMIWSNTDKEYTTQTITPQSVKDACCEEALFLIKYANNERIVMQSLGVRRASREGVAEEYVGIKKILLSPHARALLQRWLVGGVPLRR